MTDISALETEISSAIAAASDEAALETVRVGALGKSGSLIPHRIPRIYDFRYGSITVP